jgi:hypothetical protein
LSLGAGKGAQLFLKIRRAITPPKLRVLPGVADALPRFSTGPSADVPIRAAQGGRRTLWLDQRTPDTLIFQAIRLTDPERDDINDRDFTHYIDVHLISLIRLFFFVYAEPPK